jgi:hypothetical protein
LGFSGDFPLSSCSHVLVSSLYTSCMLRGAFYAFYKILYLSNFFLLNQNNGLHDALFCKFDARHNDPDPFFVQFRLST